MKIIVAPQGFKGSLKSHEAAGAIAWGVKSALPDAEVILLPISDGGEGTVRAMVAATDSRLISANVTGPLGDRVEAEWGILGDGTTAVIEMAAASGLNLVPKDRPDPMAATTYGTGELIRAALEAGRRRLIIGLGDSATTDGGAGMAVALGISLIDANGLPVPRGGAGLSRLARIEMSGRHNLVTQITIIGACDVTNPLFGPEGAAYVYGPQKGATPDMMARLDSGLRHLAVIIERDLGVKVGDMPGAGAAGGLGAGLVAFLGASLQPGIDLILDGINFDKHLAEADLVLTGEGRIDQQTPRGKTVAGIARRAKRAGKPVIAFAGELGGGYQDILSHGVTEVVGITTEGVTREEAMKQAARFLAEAVKRTLENFIISSEISQYNHFNER
jgi:glycerate kinase